MTINTIPNYTEQQIIDFQNRSIILLNEHKIAEELFRRHYIRFFQDTFIANKGEKINVSWADGKKTYFFNKIDWNPYYFDNSYPVVFVYNILKSKKPSKNSFSLQGTKGYLRPDSQVISKAT